jgi:hypothetical protein
MHKFKQIYRSAMRQAKFSKEIIMVTAGHKAGLIVKQILYGLNAGS